MNQKHSFKDWVIATRPWSFPASSMPVLVTLAYLLWCGYEINMVNAVWALLNIVLFHAAGNTWSDYADFRKGVDTADTYGVKTLTSGQFRPAEIRRLSAALLAVATLGGLGLLARTGLPLLWIGLGGMACTLLYPMLKYRAFGDLVIAIAYAWLPMWGTSYVASGVIDPQILLLALPVGMITVAILHANNTRDIATDLRAGISTPAMRLGTAASVRLYAFWIAGAFVAVGLCVALGVFPVWTLLIFLCLPQAVGQIRRMYTCHDAADTASIANMDEVTAKFQLQFSLVLSLAFVVAWLAA